jgi:glycosyltransferase involved in cell wall biosynthesis
MKLLFLTIGLPDMNKEGGGFYADMIQELAKNGHEVTALSPTLQDQGSGLYTEGQTRVLRIKMENVQGNIPTYKKIIRVLMMNPRYIKAYKDFLWNEKFDWILMPTPPSSLVDVVDVIQKRTGAKFYIILRDIHPESKRRFPTAETMARTDVYDECKKPYCASRLMYWYLYRKSQLGYRKADCIGCMSPGNIAFVKKIAPYVEDKKIVLLSNWYKEANADGLESETVRGKYGLKGKFVAIFGGTIGEGQAVWNIATLAKHYLNNINVVFLVVGRGVKKAVLEDMAKQDNLTNMTFLNYMPRDEYEGLLRTADLGLITIDEKFPVPTCPSKIIGYMALHQPVIAMINEGNDYGEFYIDKSGCGLWSAGLDNEKMFANFEWMYTHPEERKAMGEAGYRYYKENFAAEVVCKELCKQLENG